MRTLERMLGVHKAAGSGSRLGGACADTPTLCADAALGRIANTTACSSHLGARVQRVMARSEHKICVSFSVISCDFGGRTHKSAHPGRPSCSAGLSFRTGGPGDVYVCSPSRLDVYEQFEIRIFGGGAHKNRPPRPSRAAKPFFASPAHARRFPRLLIFTYGRVRAPRTQSTSCGAARRLGGACAETSTLRADAAQERIANTTTCSSHLGARAERFTARSEHKICVTFSVISCNSGGQTHKSTHPGRSSHSTALIFRTGGRVNAYVRPCSCLGAYGQFEFRRSRGAPKWLLRTCRSRAPTPPCTA